MYLSTRPNINPEEKNGGFANSIKVFIHDKIVTPRNQFYLLVAGGTVGAYGISKVLLSFTSFFTHMSPIFIAKYSFYCGFGTATTFGGICLIVADNLYIRADPVYKYCKNWVTNDESCMKVLGEDIVTGNLRSYRLDAGSFHFDEKKLLWRPPRIQMIFDVTGRSPPFRTGLVTAQATKEVGFPPRLKTNLLKLDFETGNEGEGGTIEGDQTIYLAGNEDEVKRVSTRSGLSLEKLAEHVHINRGSSKMQ